MNIVHRFPMNKLGRDYVVGDIHGCFDALRDGMHAIGFDESCDRLFSVGDLVDRGPSSEECVDWIAKPWFYAVRGNHEQMAIGIAAGKHDRGNYAANGGGWFLALSPARQKLIAEVLSTLPFLIEVETVHGKVGIVHAEIDGASWAAFRDALESVDSNNKRKRLFEIAMWARSRITSGDVSPITDLHRLYVGHTPVKDWAVLGNVYYIDTGCVFGGKLTICEICGGAVEIAA